MSEWGPYSIKVSHFVNVKRQFTAFCYVLKTVQLLINSQMFLEHSSMNWTSIDMYLQSIYLKGIFLSFYPIAVPSPYPYFMIMFAHFMYICIYLIAWYGYKFDWLLYSFLYYLHPYLWVYFLYRWFQLDVHFFNL